MVSIRCRVFVPFAETRTHILALRTVKYCVYPLGDFVSLTESCVTVSHKAKATSSYLDRDSAIGVGPPIQLQVHKGTVITESRNKTIANLILIGVPSSKLLRMQPHGGRALFKQVIDTSRGIVHDSTTRERATNEHIMLQRPTAIYHWASIIFSLEMSIKKLADVGITWNVTASPIPFFSEQTPTMYEQLPPMTGTGLQVRDSPLKYEQLSANTSKKSHIWEVNEQRA